MDGQTAVVTHYAILIGIDNYPDKPLRGAVREVEAIATILRGILKSSVKIDKITISQTEQISTKPPGNPRLWPTYDNVITAFKMVTSLARTGDFVYIHYSGHGTRKAPCGEYSNEPTGDLALVLVNEGNEHQVRYLWGFEMASLLKTMVDNGLVITLVLDCCFSASVYRRDDPIIRFLPYSAEIDSQYPLHVGRLLENQSPAYRDASMLPNWLINPDRYVILTACGPHEEAIEPKFDGEHYGALSYFLLKTLEWVGLTKRHQDIWNHLHAKFQSSCLAQNPVLYGNCDQGFFGQVNSDIVAIAIPIISTRHGTLKLLAGSAHGVSQDDQFLVYPLDSTEGDLRSQGHSTRANVRSTRALTSDLEQLGTSCIRVRTGWMARPLTRLSLGRFPIRLASDLSSRNELLTALKMKSLGVHIDATKVPFAFDVVLSGGGDYQILDELGQEIINLPRMPEDQTSISQLSNVLEHLARFQLARDLSNELSAGTFQDCFKVDISSNGKVFGPNCLIEMQHGAQAELIVETHGDQTFYVHVYDLGPCWQVENIYRGTYAVVSPQSDGEGFKGTMRKKLRMKVPDQMREKGYSSGEDIIKIFATSQPTSFDLLQLPRLQESTKAENDNTSNREGSAEWENWTTRNFPIRVSL